MDKNQNKKSEFGIFGKGQRYWSVMLVGEHGRIVPFHRFKEIAMGVIGLALLSIAALVVLSWLYIQQGTAIHRLENELDELKQESSHLKNERDVLKAKLVRQEIHTKKDAMASPHATSSSSLNKQSPEHTDRISSVPEKVPADESRKSVQPNTEKETQRPKTVQWSGDIKEFLVDYDAGKQILKTRFRIYNTSTPRERLSGRIVLIFKNSSDPPIKWLSVPHVPLRDGKPVGNEGKDFIIRNYRTMDFAAYGIPMPFKYNIVSVYVFLENGKMLLSKDYGIKIEPKFTPAATPTPTPIPTPTAASPTPVQKNTSEINSNKDEATQLDDIGPQSANSDDDSVVSRDVADSVPATNLVPPKNPASEHQINPGTDPTDNGQLTQEIQMKPEGDNQ